MEGRVNHRELAAHIASVIETRLRDEGLDREGQISVLQGSHLRLEGVFSSDEIASRPIYLASTREHTT